MITGDRDVLIAAERVRELQREAEGWRLSSSRYRGVSASGGGGSSGRKIAVRWGLASDVVGIERILELNGRPRWEASEERFIVAEEGGEMIAAIATRNEAFRLVLGAVVVDPWGGESESSVALYRGAVKLARMACLEDVFVPEGRGEYLRRAGYVREIGGWHAGAARKHGRIAVGGFRRIIEMLTDGGHSKPRVPGL